MAFDDMRARGRTVLFVTTPALRPMRPFLPVVRQLPDRAEELGVLFDARSAGLTGGSTTVYFTNWFLPPPTFEAFRTLPHDTFDCAEELADAGWRSD